MAKRLLVDDWIEEAGKSKLPISIKKEPRQYEKRIVAWFDILGMRKKISKSKNAEEILSLMEKFHYYMKLYCDAFIEQGEINYVQISDGFIISAKLSLLNDLCKILCEIQWKILVYDLMLLRGAITVGKVSISDDLKIIIGPAFIEAFALESENAIFPRILCSSEIKKQIPKKYFDFKYIKKDSDHFLFLDFLSYEIEQKKYNTKILDNFLEKHGVKDLLKNEYFKNIKDNIRLAQKYGWLIKRFEENDILIIQEEER